MDTAVNLQLECQNKNLNLKNDDIEIKLKVDNESEPTNKKIKLSDDVKNDVQYKTTNENNELTLFENMESSSLSSKIDEHTLPSSESETCKPSGSKSEICQSAFEIEKKQESDEEFIEHGEPEIPEEGFIYPLETDASDMLDEVEFEEFPSVTDRYLTPYYQLDVLKPGDDICIRIHSNRICMISLAPSHTIFKENKTIVSCNYKVSDKLNRLSNKVSGKAKHGAQPLQSNSNLCCLTCNDGSSYMVKCCMIGKLLEVNERLIENPELLRQEPHFGGYIAIVLPNLKHLDKLKDKMLTKEQYDIEIKKRMENKDVGIKTLKDIKEQTEESKEKQKKNDVDMETGEAQDYNEQINDDFITIVDKENPNEGINNMEVVES